MGTIALEVKQNPCPTPTGVSTKSSSKEAENGLTGKKPHSIKSLLREYKTAVLTSTANGHTLLYHQEDILSGSWLGLRSVAELIISEDSAMEHHLWVAVRTIFDRWEQAICPKLHRKRVRDALNQFIVEVGIGSAQIVDGPHVTSVDPRNHADAEAMLQDARAQRRAFREKGFKRDKVLISIPATEAGLQAARTLQKEGTNVNLYLVLEWFERQRPEMEYQRDILHHPAIETMQSIATYFRQHKIKTKIIGANFRKMADLALLADFDAVCLSTYQLDRLEHNIARCAPVEEPKELASLRAKQVKYPPGLLCEDGRFLKKVSRESRNMIKTVLDQGTEKLSRAMDVIEAAVTLELDKHLEIKTESPQKKHLIKPLERRQPSPIVRGSASSVLVQGDAGPAWFKLKPAMQNVDDVF